MAPKIPEYTELMGNFTTDPNLKHCGFVECFQFSRFELPVWGNITDGCSLSKYRYTPVKFHQPNHNGAQCCSSVGSTVCTLATYFDANLNTFRCHYSIYKSSSRVLSTKNSDYHIALFYDQLNEDLTSSVSSYSLHDIPCEGCSMPSTM